VTKQNVNPFTPDTTVDDIMENPHKFGAPTFEEYKKNRNKWFPMIHANEESGMIALTDGPVRFRKDLKNIKLQVNGFDMKPEQVEKALGDYGYTLADIDLENRSSRLKKDIQMMPLGGGKYDVVVNFLP